MAILTVAREFTALHGTRSVRRDRFRVELRLSGRIDNGFVGSMDHRLLGNALDETLAGLDGKHLDDVVGRATNENIALYITHSLASLHPSSVLVQEGSGQSAEVFLSDLDNGGYPAYLALSKAQSLLLRERPSDAMIALEGAIAYNPRLANAYNLMGRCQKYLGRHNLAAESYARAIAMDPDFGEAYRNLGNAYCELGMYDQMNEAFSKAIELMPASALAFNNRGFGFQMAGNFKKALEDHSKAIELDPNYAEAYGDRSQAYKALGELALAERDCERMNRLVSSGTDTYSGIGTYKIDGSTASRYTPPDVYYGIPVYNEEGNLLNCLESLERQRFDGSVETLICLNGCTDSSESEAQEAKERYPELNIRVIRSQKRGKAFAQNQIIRSVKDKTVPIAFIDADVVLEENCIAILHRELRDLRQLIAVGTWPEPRRAENLSFWERFLYRILHMRAFYPGAQVSRHDVSAFKGFVKEKPQPTISPEFEMRSKIFFHGRAFMLRNAGFFHLPEEANVADDTYLPNFIHTRYGPGTIRARYDAKIFYKPYLSLKQHFRAYWRVYSDLRKMDNEGMFAESRKMEKTKLDWGFILSKGIVTALEFVVYKIITRIEGIIYRLLPEKEPSEIWIYDKK